MQTSNFSRAASAYLKTILSNPESRKIFYFLMLNLSYMGVQVVYGIITNSLGLISDAIHMAFDCMAIAMGLFASVAATWMPNEQYTYGYGRIETLSGFANGIFLLLISVFIVFEAIQRLIDPPEMSTNQLLLVSTLGLGVNLFGMFAMGGHHHGGHSHSHGGGHSHSSHSPSTHVHVTPPEDDYGHSHSDHSHSHSSSSDHLHSHSSSHDDHSHSHSHSASTAHSHSSHSRSVSVSLPAPPTLHVNHDGHTHNTHTHGHSDHHSHSHSPPQAGGHRRTLSVAVPQSTNANIPINGNPGSGPPRSPLSPVSPNRSPVHTHRRTASHLDVLEISRQGASNGLVSPDTPLTPGYEFGRDPHFAEHHHSVRAPNSHDHSHHPVVHHEGHSHNMRGVFLHVMADTLGSVGVIVSTLLIQFYGWTGFDPIASLFIAVLIAASVIPLVIDTGRILALDPAERDTDIKRALHEVKTIDGVASYSQPRFWPKDADTLVGSIHVQLAPVAAADPTGPHSARGAVYANVDRILEQVDEVLRSGIKGLAKLTIQIEKKEGW
ncbi:hypothetical protein M422DRAFT_57868 [Sphaerobolus stellatus SS14]|nr:hypothetical protein M422DRAFT_57868 [Sphaerobolus stellatus SS14]